MKFTWFHLMPWPHLPDDFREKHRSVWVDLPSRMYDPEAGPHRLSSVSRSARIRRADGLRRHRRQRASSNAYGLMPSPNIMAATLTRRTSKATLVVLGNSIALYNPPIRVAEEFAMLDVLSGGRLVAGFPVGTSMDTNYAYGDPRDAREISEAHDLILKAWTAETFPSTAATPSCATSIAGPSRSRSRTADLHSRRRLGRDLRFLHRQHLLLFLPELHRATCAPSS